MTRQPLIHVAIGTVVVAGSLAGVGVHSAAAMAAVAHHHVAGDFDGFPAQWDPKLGIHVT